MAGNFSLTGFTSSEPEKLNDEASTLKGAFGLPILDWVSYSIAAICAFFLITFAFDRSMSVSWFFISEFIALMLIPVLARQGYENTAKFLLILYVDIAIIILSSIFHGEAEIQFFLIPTMGLAILLFEFEHSLIRNISIFFSVLSYFVIDYIAIDKVSLSPENIDYVRWGVIGAAFVTTWIIFNKFSESKEYAESITRDFLNKEKALTKELSSKQNELENYIDELEHTKEELEKSANAKTDFLATMSHEIRTPMNAILGMTHLLKEDSPREDQLESINILDFSGKTLLTLIDDILDFSKIDAGKIEFEQIDFNLKELVSTISETFKITATNKKIELITEIGEFVPKYLVGDPARLTQILNNLVSNALKFTEEGTVKILVQSNGENNGKERIVFKVIDSGIGIEHERVDSIFESFAQASKNTKRLYGGTGLGLSISKQLVELQNGELKVESEVGVGSTFIVNLAFKKGENKENVDPGIVKEIEDNISGLKVLVAEDNPVNQKVMESFLKRWNVNVVMVEDGQEAIDAHLKERFDLILMDLEMPNIDGYQATTMIRTLDEPLKRNIPIMALTAAALSEVREKVYSVGMNDFVTKPFNPVELKRKINEIVKR